MAQTVLRAEELLSERDRVTGVCEAAGARFAFLFGSVIDTTPGRAPRDVDVAVSFHDYDFWTYLELREQLSRALGISEDRLDLVVLDRVNPRIKLEAVLTGVPMLVADPGALDEFAVDALFAYDDFLRFRRELHESLWKRIEGGLSVAGRQLNRDRVETYLSRMDEAVGRLTVLRKRFTSYEEFEADADTRELVVHHLRIALECVLDVCRHFLATKGVSLSELDTTNLIELAGDRGLLDVAFARKIRGMAGMRNAIVGVYWRLDYQAIYETVTQKLGDFDEFARQVKRYLARRMPAAERPSRGWYTVDSAIQSLLREFAGELRTTYGSRLRGVYLFGSHARGEADPESDVDVLVVLDHIERYGLEVDRTGAFTAELALKYGVSISRVFVSHQEWSRGESAFLANVKEEAVPA